MENNNPPKDQAICIALPNETSSYAGKVYEHDFKLGETYDVEDSMIDDDLASVVIEIKTPCKNNEIVELFWKIEYFQLIKTGDETI